MRIVDNHILTSRERDIVLYILSGKNKQYIANHLSLSVSTIKSHVENIYRKFNVHNKAEMIIYVIKHGMINLEDESLDYLK